jgi:ATP-binding cassette subfamily B protein
VIRERRRWWRRRRRHRRWRRPGRRHRRGRRRARRAGEAAADDQLAHYLGFFRYSRRALQLVWGTSRGLTIALAVGSLLAGLLPASIAWVGKHLIDAVVRASATHAPPIATRRSAGSSSSWRWSWCWPPPAACSRSSAALLRQQLSNRINVLILEKALTLELSQFEDSELYDQMTRARREASSRPLSLVTKTFSIAQGLIALATYGALLVAFSPWALLVLVVAALPPFIAELKFSGDAFRLSRWRTPETREQLYVETVLAREDHAKEVKLFGLGPRFLARYRAIFVKLYAGDRALTLRRGLWGLGLGVIGTAAFYGMYLWIALSAIDALLTIGAMTMYVVVFRQAQQALASTLSDVGGMYEDNLYLSNLYEFLDAPALRVPGTATSGPSPDDGVRFEDVTFNYPGTDLPAVRELALHIRPGSKLAIVGDNGSGKTTLIKLLTRLYEPTSAASRSTAATCASGTATRCTGASASSSRTSCTTSSRSARTSAPATTARMTTTRAGSVPPSGAWRRRSSSSCPASTRPSSAAGSRTAASCRSGSGRRSRCRARSCARTPTSWCSTSRPRRWTPRPRSRSSSASAS